jgi:hypothetical protein
MLSSMDMVLDLSDDPNMIDKAIRATATVTVNANQMPLDNQVQSTVLNGGRTRSTNVLLLVLGERCRHHRESSRESQRDANGRRRHDYQIGDMCVSADMWRHSLVLIDVVRACSSSDECEQQCCSSRVENYREKH